MGKQDGEVDIILFDDLEYYSRGSPVLWSILLFLGLQIRRVDDHIDPFLKFYKAFSHELLRESTHLDALRGSSPKNTLAGYC